MDLYDAIEYRKSTRRFSTKKLKPQLMNNVKAICKEFTCIDGYSNIKAHIIERGHMIHLLLGGNCKVKSPHYIVLSTDEDDDYLMNAGYCCEDIILRLTTIGVGTCILESKLSDKQMNEILKEEQMYVDLCDSHENSDEFRLDIFEKEEKVQERAVILIALGYPEKGEELFRTSEDTSERKPLKNISKGFQKDIQWIEILERTGLAPSYKNLQPWFFLKGKDSDYIHIYEKNQNKKYQELSTISMGAMLCNLDIICKRYNIDIKFQKLGKKDRFGKKYFISTKVSYNPKEVENN
ncbi:MAG: hypothetical protein LBR30_05645 [Clostridioides sp.]|nr:hypothetical protein [Clostridioides sp.]